MSGKFVALLLVVACVAQGYDARATSYAETRLTIDDIVKALNDLIAKIRESLGNIGELIESFEKKIKDIIDSIDIPGILAEIKKKIEEIIKAAGIDTDAAASCLSEEAKAVEELVKSTTEGVSNCAKEIDPVKNEIIGKIQSINSEAADVISSISSGVAKCFKDHPLNPLKLLDCLKGLVKPAEDKVNALLEKINKEVEEGQKLIGDAATQLSTCVTKVSEAARQQEDAIVDKFQKCVNDIIN